MTEREQFEQCVMEMGILNRLLLSQKTRDGEYVSETAQDYWAVWQKARSQELPQVQCETWRPSQKDYDRNIHSNPDAAAWADFFIETFPNCGADQGTMIGWFANAMMAMHDHLISTRYQSPQVPEGMALVPVEPTDEMVDAGYGALPDCKCTEGDKWRAKLVYKAMLAATKDSQCQS